MPPRGRVSPLRLVAVILVLAVAALALYNVFLFVSLSIWPVTQSH